MNEKTKSAVIGGVVLGILSVIPVVNLGNICCCCWALLGGGLATYLWVKKSPTPVSIGDGAMLGAIAGGVGAVIELIIGIPIGIATSALVAPILANLVASANPQQAEMIRQQMMSASSIGGAIANGIFLAILLVIFSTLGGLIAVPIFEKRKGGPGMPPPPPGFGGPQGGYNPPPPQNYEQPGGYGPGR
jgi:hypothetical protein